MTRLLLAAALTAAAFVTSAPASACTLDTCPWAKPVCDRVDCTQPICFDLYCP